MIDKITQQDLRNLRSLAEELAEQVPNPHWKRAYLALADAADRLDAMEARTTLPECPPTASPEETSSTEKNSDD